jgi:glutamyl-tRNA reductase
MMTIVNVGVSHHSAPPGVLEELAVLPGEQAGVLARLHAIPGIDEVFILSTCNRVEVYAATQRPAEEITQAVAEMLASRGRTRVSDLLGLARLHVAAAAAEHLFSVTSGLESMAVGEEQIVAQVKAAARDATAAGTTGPVLTGLVDAALRASKRVRSESGIGTSGASLVRAGLSLAWEHLGGEPSGRSAVVVGTGSVGKLAARLLREATVGELSIISRTPARAAELAAATGGLPLLLVTLPVAISDADVLVAATGASAPTVLAQDVRAARKTIGHRPLFVLDLGMPPDVEREVGELPGVRLVDLAALCRHLATAGTQDRIPRARAVVSAEAAAYLVRQQQIVAAP